MSGLDTDALYDVQRMVEDLKHATNAKEMIHLMREKNENGLAQSLLFMTDDNRLVQL